MTGPGPVLNLPWSPQPDLSMLPEPGPHEDRGFMDAAESGRVVSIHIAGLPADLAVGAFRWDQSEGVWVEVDSATIPREVIADIRDAMFRRAGQTIVVLDEPATGVGRPSPLAGLSKLDDELARLHDLESVHEGEDDFPDALTAADGLRAVIDRLVDEWRPDR